LEESGMNDKKNKNLISRRSILKGIGAVGAIDFLSSKKAAGEQEMLDSTDHLSDIRRKIFQKVFQTPFIDTHEHLPDESRRLSKKYYNYGNKSDDWTIIFKIPDTARQYAL
jgi:hypothetical protein